MLNINHNTELFRVFRRLFNGFSFLHVIEFIQMFCILVFAIQLPFFIKDEILSVKICICSNINLTEHFLCTISSI